MFSGVRSLSNPAFLDRNASTFNPGNYSAATGQLPRVIYNIRGVNPGASFQLSGSRVVHDITFSNILSAGEIYGDAASETGLFMAFQTGGNISPSLGASGLTGQRFGSSKYKVQAVPEPATLTVALAGMALMSARRKRKAKS